MTLSYIDIVDHDDDEIDIDDITECTDEGELAAWFKQLSAAYEDIWFFIDERKFSGIAEAEWLSRASGKCVYLKKGIRRVEVRMLELGFTVPHPPTDPRVKVIRRLEEKLRKVKALFAENGISFAEVDAIT